MTIASKILKELLVVVLVCLGLSMSSCQWATSESDLPLEEWVVTSVYVKYVSGSTATYDTHVTLIYDDPSEGAAGGGYADDYAGNSGTVPTTLYSISQGTIVSGGYGFFVLSAAPNPATKPVVTFDTNHYFYRFSDSSSTFSHAVAKCRIKTPSVVVTFKQ